MQSSFPYSQMHLSFRADHDAACAALEAVLACARRGGIELAGMQVCRTWRHVEVRLHLRAADNDLLDLFATRVGGFIDVQDLQELAPQDSALQLASA